MIRCNDSISMHLDGRTYARLTSAGSPLDSVQHATNRRRTVKGRPIDQSSNSSNRTKLHSNFIRSEKASESSLFSAQSTFTSLPISLSLSPSPLSNHSPSTAAVLISRYLSQSCSHLLRNSLLKLFARRFARLFASRLFVPIESQCRPRRAFVA